MADGEKKNKKLFMVAATEIAHTYKKGHLGACGASTQHQQHQPIYPFVIDNQKNPT